MKERILRVGVCVCSVPYRGEFKGKELRISSLRGRRLPQPMVFRIQEVTIPQGVEGEVLKPQRPHIFVETIPWTKGRKWTGLERVSILKGRYGCQRVYVGSFPGDLMYHLGKNQPKIGTLLRSLKAMLSAMSEHQLRRWLEVMA